MTNSCCLYQANANREGAKSAKEKREEKQEAPQRHREHRAKNKINFFPLCPLCLCGRVPSFASVLCVLRVFAVACYFTASSISRFISFTASRNPTKTDRAMIAWPMLSSRI